MMTKNKAVLILFAIFISGVTGKTESSSEAISYLSDASRAGWPVVDASSVEDPKTKPLKQAIASCAGSSSRTTTLEFRCEAQKNRLESCRLSWTHRDEDAGTESTCSIEFDRVKKDRKIVKKTLKLIMAG